MKHLEKFGDYDIYQDSRVDSEDFYCRMGRFFADKDIRKALEGPLDDSDQHVWLIAMLDGQIVAISSLQFDPAKSTGIFNETFVYPAHREKGLFARLFDIKYQICVELGAKVVKGLANGKSSGMFELRQWDVTTRRGKWTGFQKKVDANG